ncbi:MAG: DUF2779 domain-containing protein, partial [Pedosphaera sp.]|nr:DUF2779 domain-containing protein [Pedosphaera sp.]
MPSPYLTKSDFKACFDCRTKLFYRKNEYPSNLDENEYMQFLADGGFAVEYVAKARYPNGVDLVGERDPKKALARTRELIAASKDAVVFEAAVLSGKFYARIDILRREGNTLHLIEVKSSSLKSDEEERDDDGDDARSPFLRKRSREVASKWKPYLLDVALQAHVLRQTFPEFTMKPWLCVVDKSHQVTANETLNKFRITRDTAKPKTRPEVIYSGDRKKLKNSGLLMTRDVSVETELLMPEVLEKASSLAALIDSRGKVKRTQETVADLYKVCRKCEFRFGSGGGPKLNGFAECWGKMAKAEPHVLDLYQVTRIGTAKNPDPVPTLITEGSASLLDLREDQLGLDGSLRERRLLQWSHSRDGGSEYLPRALKKELQSHAVEPGWPLHFIDFEACNVAFPHHAGLRPYERVAFQWSCHTLNADGKLDHKEWLNTDRDFPNFKFAQTLREQIGDKGTVYVWSPYEQSTLVGVLSQIGEWVERDSAEALRVSGFGKKADLSELAGWIDGFLGPEDEKGKRHPSRVRDLHKLALVHYFHPRMKGRTSIKVVLPAVWNESAKLRGHEWFKKYLWLDEKGKPCDPYKTLPALKLGDGGEVAVITDGTGAIRIYQDLIFRHETNEEVRRKCAQLLLQYCEL